MPKISAQKQSWFILLTFSWCFFVISASTFSSLGVVIPFMVNELEWTWTTAGLGFTFLAMACGVSGYLPSITIKNWGIAKTLFVGLCLLTVGFLTLYATHIPATYFLGYILVGMGYTFVGAIPGTYIITHFFVKRSTAFGFYYTMGGLGGVAGPLIVWLANDALGNWRLHWIITLTLIASSVLLMWLSLAFTDATRLKLPPKDEEKTTQSNVYETRETWRFRDALRTPQYWAICAAYTSVLLVGTTVNSFSVSHLTQIGVTFALASTMLSLEAFCNAMSRVIGGFIAEFFEPKTMLQAALLMLAGGMVALSYGNSLFIQVIYAIAIGFGFGLTFLSCTVLILRYFGSGPYLQLFSTLNLFATVAASAPYICGTMRDVTGSFVSPFLLVGAMPAVVFVVVSFMRPPKLVKEAGKTASVSPPTVHNDTQLTAAKEL